MPRGGGGGEALCDGGGAGEARPRPAQDVDRHVGGRLRERRIALGLTQQQMAERVGLPSQQQQHRYEKGMTRISAGRLFAFARALGVEPGYFFEGLGTGETLRPTAEQRRALDLAQSFVALSRRHQEALTELARALADATPGPEEPDEAA